MRVRLPRMNDEAARIVQRLRLDPLPHEGGFFRRTWTAPAPADGGRPAASAILFLLTPIDFSAFHQLTSEELWNFQGGDPIEHVQLLPGADTPFVTTLAAPDTALTVATAAHVAVAPGVWQGARLRAPAAHGWSLVSCIVTPAWSDADFLLGDRDSLVRDFPSARDWIVALTR